MFVKNATLLR